VLAAPKKVSWLKKFGQDVAKAVEWIATKAQPIAQAAGTFVSGIEPQFAPEITVAENIISKIANQATVTEGAFTAVGQGSNGPAKLEAVVGAIGGEIDAWVANAFPGANAVSKAGKAGLVNSVVAILNEIDPNLALTTPTTTAMSAACATKAAVLAVTGRTS
jgi:hypothetical protein